MKQFGDVKVLWKHLNHQHQINTKSKTKIICGQPNCNILFYSGYAYKRHLQAFHEQPHAQIQPQEIETEPAREIHVEDPPSSEEEDHEIDEADPVNPKTADQIAQDIQDATASYVATYKEATVPSSTVQKFLNTTREYVGTVVNTLETAAAPILEDVHNKILPSDDKVQHFKAVVNVLKDPIGTSGFSTEYRQKQFAIKSGSLIMPKQVDLGEIHKKRVNRYTGRTEEKPTTESFQYVPIGPNLKQFLEQRGYMKNIIQHQQNDAEDDIIQTYRDGTCYKENENQDRNIMDIEILLYNDDFETGNPLGPKKGKQKVLGIYMSVISLPEKYQSKLENILLVAVAKSSFVAKYGINTILDPIIVDLESLYATGLDINAHGEFQGRVRPKLFQAVGDNLALNTVLGFVSCFTANYFCRYCKTHRLETQLQLAENQESLRTEDDIDDDAERQDVPQTGVNRSSSLNKAPRPFKSEMHFGNP